MHKRRGDGDVLTLVACLDDGCVDALQGTGREDGEVGRDELVHGEVFLEDHEELHEAGGDELGDGEVGGEGEGVAEFS